MFDTPAKFNVSQGIWFLPVAYAMTALWWLPEGDKYFPAIVLLTIFAWFVGRVAYKQRSRAEHPLKKQKTMYASALLLTTLMCGFVYVQYDGSITELRALAALSIFAFLSAGALTPSRLWTTTVLISGAGFSAICFYQFFVADQHRAHLNYNPIPFATGVATTLICTLFLALSTRNRTHKAIASIVTLLLIASVAMTGTRGVALPVLLILLAATGAFLYRYGRSHRFATAAVLTALCVASAAGASLLQNRLDSTIADLKKVEAGQNFGSIGLRFEFWSAAVELSKLEPLTGLGDRHKAEFQKLAQQGEVNKTAGNYAPYHYHNQYLDTLVKRGIPGLAGLLAMLLIPVVLAFAYHRKNTLVVSSVSSISFLYGFACLTDVPFSHPATINMFVVSVIALLSFQTEAPCQDIPSKGDPTIST